VTTAREVVHGNVQKNVAAGRFDRQHHGFSVARTRQALVVHVNFRGKHLEAVALIVQQRNGISDDHVGQFADRFANSLFVVDNFRSGKNGGNFQGYVRLQVEESDSQSIAVTRVQGTRVQQKLGPNIDTFLASMLLAEVKGRMPDVASEKATDFALHKVLGKIERHQKQDGTFDGQGWAPILAQAMCGKGINRARQAGARVSDTALARAENGAKLAFQASGPATLAGTRTGITTGRSAMAGMAGGIGGSAGVELYSRAASIGVLQDSVNTNKLVAKELRAKAANSPDKKERAEAKQKLAQIADAEKVRRK